ncbi:MAG: hypothetical protein OD918_05760 [Gammaproteobacteria bacterium]
MPDAGCLAGRDGARVYFVAQPELAPPCPGKRYARPDDRAADDSGETWRDVLLAYNQRADNRLNLRRAYELYKPPIYKQLVEKCGADNVFILSAGWGLVRADFFLPAYDITFSSAVKKEHRHKRRKKQDAYRDFAMLPDDCDDDLMFFGGKDYRPLFQRLSRRYRGGRFVYYNSIEKPSLPGCKAIAYKTATRTNWHYKCAESFIAGAIRARIRYHRPHARAL